MDLMRWNPFSELDHILGRRGLAGLRVNRPQEVN